MAYASSGTATVGVLRILLAAWFATGVAGASYLWTIYLQRPAQQLGPSSIPTPPALDQPSPDNSAPAAEPAIPFEPALPLTPHFTVEPYQPSHSLVVRGTSVRFRELPFATPETPIVRYAEAGEILNVIGRVYQPDGFEWLQVELGGGLSAFIRSDFTEAAPTATVPSPPIASVPTLIPVRPRFDQRRVADLLQNEYPRSALRLKQEGSVVLSMCMGVDGRAFAVKIVRSSGFDALDEAALKGVGRLRFSPAEDGQGKPITWCPPTYPAYTMELVWKLPQ